MTSIRKQILVGGNPHYIDVNSSLDLEEVEITGIDPMTGKTVHISLSSLLRTPKEPSPGSPQPFEMPTQGLEAVNEEHDSENIENALNSIFRQ